MRYEPEKTVLSALFIIAIVVLAIVTSSCISEQERMERQSRVTVDYVDYSDSGIKRITDREAGVVCWVYLSRGISCLPLSETSLQ